MFPKILDCKSTHKINTDKFFFNDFVFFYLLNNRELYNHTAFCRQN